MANAKQNPIEQFTALKKTLVEDLNNVEIEMDNLELVFNEKMAELKSRQTELRGVLFDEVPVTLKFDNAAFAETVAKAAKTPVAKKIAPKKRAAKKTAKKAVAKRPAASTDAFVSHADQLQNAVRENPGASKQDLRGLLPSFSETELERALSYCSKNNLVENRGSKPRPQWFVVTK